MYGKFHSRYSLLKRWQQTASTFASDFVKAIAEK